MSFPPSQSCNCHPYIPVPDYCTTCSLVIFNLGIGEIQIPDFYFSGTYSSLHAVQPNQSMHVPLQSAADTTTLSVAFVPYSEDSYTDWFAHEEYQRLSNEEEEIDGYPDRFALEDHGRLGNAEVDEHHDRFAPSPLKENNRTVRVDDDDDYPDRSALSPVERRHPRRGKAGIKRKSVDKRVRTKSRQNRIQKSVH